MNLEQYLEQYGTCITQDSERLFLTEFLYPILGENIEQVIPQYPFLDSSGKNRRIDFALPYEKLRLALEVNGETYHAEGIIPNPQFDDNLFSSFLHTLVLQIGGRWCIETRRLLKINVIR